jgi:hypothetical protein
MVQKNKRPVEMMGNWVVDPKFKHDPEYKPREASYTVNSNEGSPLLMAERLEELANRPKYKPVTGYEMQALYEALDLVRKSVVGTRGHNALDDAERVLGKILGFTRQDAMNEMRKAPLVAVVAADEAYENALSGRIIEDTP